MAHVAEVATRAAAKQLAESTADVVGSRTRSVILHGSLAAGDFRPGRSDIDLLAVIDGALSDPQIDALADLVRHADVGDASGVDLHVVTAGVAGSPTRTPPMELHVGRYDDSTIGFEIEPRVAASPDLPAELAMARADGHNLIGARPRDTIAPIPVEWLHQRGRYWLTTWQSLVDDSEDAAHMVLTACRIWRFAVEGAHCSKGQAASWVLGRDPSLTAVRQAFHQYATDPEAPIDQDGIARVLETVLRETARMQ